ncbi:MAG: hypothetical protein AAB582_02540 [Patescibacteria group bacterium]
MSEFDRLGVVRSTAIAAANAVVNHMNIGQFISEFDRINDYTLRACKLQGNAEVQIEGRTNHDLWVYPICTVIFKNNRQAGFPIDRVYVSVTYAGRDGVHSNRQYYVCTFYEDLAVARLTRSPHDETEVVVFSSNGQGEFYFSKDHCQPHAAGFVPTSHKLPCKVKSRLGLPEGLICTREELIFVFYDDKKEVPNPDIRYLS